MVKIIDGKERGLQVRENLKGEVEKLKLLGVTPRLDVILVGDDSASKVYVKNKEKGCEAIGIKSETHRFPSDLAEKELIATIHKLNNDKTVHGILVQLPLPKGLNEGKVLREISPQKDVDGLHFENMGKLLKGENGLLPCTPAGIIDLILSTGVDITGKEVVVVGRSNIVGKPIALLLLAHNATVTICHSKTPDLSSVVRRGDLVVAAVGRPKMITADMIKDGAIVIDVGINRLEGGLVGDVDFENVKEKASYITPVPGGVGPMTIAMLLKNVIECVKFCTE